MVIQQYLARIQERYNSGAATEHSYRPALEFLFQNIDTGISAINEPKRVAAGAPDFILNRGDIPIGHVEAKDIPIDLRKLKDANKNQQERYLKAFPNLLYTNGLDFDFYREGQRIHSVSIADFVMGIQPKPENFAQLENLLGDFLTQTPQTITSTRNLALRMAGKALVIKDVLNNLLREDPDFNSELGEQYSAFKEQLIHDISPEDFSDIYAETLAYGMFAARLHDDTTNTFSRHEALDRLPKTYPFLRSLFTFIAGQDLDDRIRWVIDELARVFLACDLHALMADFGKLTGRNDPFLHFYEDFLKEYNPSKRKSRGVWYTPEPVVNFIVRAVDEVLQKEFGLPLGLADTSKVSIDWDTGQKDTKGKPVMTKKDVHRVQILDPATGTGTFLAEVIKQIAPRVKGMAEGMWSGYVEKDLIPRLHGFELLMASYAMCHMKLDMVLTELGYKPSATPPRMSVYLTNSLEEGEPADQTLPFAQWLSREVKAANTIKRDMPIMCVIGNPPYSGHSSNNGEWISHLMEDYKKEPGGYEKLKERNSKWINDDYVKFIRLAENMIEKNGEGVLGFITNHGYIDNPTFRGMRWRMLKTFDKIYVLDLHGNSKKKEVAPDGSSDQNVFDIQQGVAIIVAIKRAETSSGLAEVHHSELWGNRKSKNNQLWELDSSKNSLAPLVLDERYFMFYPIDHRLLRAYDEGFSLPDLMPLNQIGFQSHRDEFAVTFEKQTLVERLREFQNTLIPDERLREKYTLVDNRDWRLSTARARAKENKEIENQLVKCSYRPFDERYCLLDESMMDYPRWPLMREVLNPKYFAMNFVRQTKSNSWQHVLVSSNPAPAVFVEIKDGSNFAPLYVADPLDQTRRVNFDEKIYAKIRAAAKDETHGEPDEVAVFDYIYGVLHCPAYRETFKEFLKIDFPRVPYPPSPAIFWDVSAKGTQLRRLHLMEPEIIGDTPYPFKGEGDNIVEKPARDAAGRVHINKTQYFENVPELVWEFYIGGYQPAQKWLKDRKTRELSFDDIMHYQRIVKILSETDRIMKTIEMPLDA